MTTLKVEPGPEGMLLEDGVDIRYIQELLGHGTVKTTERYTHVTQKGMDRIKSPLDNFKL